MIVDVVGVDGSDDTVVGGDDHRSNKYRNRMLGRNIEGGGFGPATLPAGSLPDANGD